MSATKLVRGEPSSDRINTWLDKHLPPEIVIWRYRYNFDRTEDVVLIDPIRDKELRFTIEQVRQKTPRLPVGCEKEIRNFLTKSG